MGANASTPNGADDETANATGPEDFYELLGVTAEASYDEIRKGFRKEALKWHPDKNAGSEVASKRFVKIQAAYEALSDDQERAYYDAHRGDIGRSDLGNDHDLRERAKQATAAKQSVRISAKHLMRFFDATIWNNDFSDAPEGFYGIYRVLFDTISQSEVYATAPPGEPALSSPAQHYPTFGIAATPYDSADSHLKQFYAAYLNFASRRPFNEVDLYRLQDAPDRRIKRLMEKENQKARDDARKEYNDAVRSLAAFLKKRDPRFLNSTSSDPLRLQQLQRQKLQKSLRDAAVKAAKDREANAKAYVEQSWQKAHRGNVAYSDESEEESEEDAGEPEADDDVKGDADVADDANVADEDGFEAEDWFCPACDKDFASQGAWDNHARSRKHQQNMKRVQREMREEDSDLNISQRLREDLSVQTSAATSQADDSDDVVVRLGSRAARKAQKRAIRDIIGDADAEQPGVAPTAKAEHSAGSLETVAAELDDANGDSPAAVDAAAEEADVDADSATAAAAPTISKKDKRRAKEAAKKAAAQVAVSETCNVCNTSFISRTKLFEHINETGHARAGEKTDNLKGGKKGKRK